jgi:Notch 1
MQENTSHSSNVLLSCSFSCETNIDDCSSSPCANGGICTDLIHDYVCNCTHDYISANCSISLNATCLSPLNRCQHNGTCLLTSAHLYVDDPQTECQCPAGYSGSRCEIDLCLNLNCQHNGTCQRILAGPARCQCTEHWFGDMCEHDVNECLRNQTDRCLNNGTCWNYPGGYSCHCQENYLGEHCERKHICLEYSPCYNNGLCRADGEHYYCECSSNFTGKTNRKHVNVVYLVVYVYVYIFNFLGSHCQLLTCESVPCRHNGTCTPDSERGFQCNCTDTGRSSFLIH